jgi:RNA-binding protein 8A
MVLGVHPECSEDDVFEAFGDFGAITALHLNLDRRTGYTKGYALVEYAAEEEARRCVEEGEGMTLLERPLRVDWAFRPTPALSSHTSSTRSRTVRLRDDRR